MRTGLKKQVRQDMLDWTGQTGHIRICQTREDKLEKAGLQGTDQGTKARGLLIYMYFLISKLF